LHLLFIPELVVHSFQSFELFDSLWVAKTLLLVMILRLSAAIATKEELAVVFCNFFVTFESLMEQFVFLCMVVRPGLGSLVPFWAILSLEGLVVEAQSLIFFH